MVKMIHVECPLCGKRLFDMDPGMVGVVSIKCGRCEVVLTARMKKRMYSCRPAGPGGAEEMRRV